MLTGYPETQRRGRLFCVVGASGAGKDSLIAYARQRLAGLPIAFAHRYITRAAASEGENHVALSSDEFELRARRGAFALSWKSHGLSYAIGAEIDDWLANGLNVVMNGSRTNLDTARKRYPDLTVIWVEASAATRYDRLTARAREDAGEIEARLAGGSRHQPPGDAIVIDNDGRLDEAGERLVAELCRAAKLGGYATVLPVVTKPRVGDSVA